MAPESDVKVSAAYDATVMTVSAVPGMLIVCERVKLDVKTGESIPRSSQQCTTAGWSPVFVNRIV